MTARARSQKKRNQNIQGRLTLGKNLFLPEQGGMAKDTHNYRMVPVLAW